MGKNQQLIKSILTGRTGQSIPVNEPITRAGLVKAKLPSIAPSVKREAWTETSKQQDVLEEESYYDEEEEGEYYDEEEEVVDKPVKPAKPDSQ